MEREHMQIGAVAERTGLSLRTIRYYEEVGLVVPSARSAGGYRLYAEADVARLLVIMQMKPLGFSLEEMGELLGAMDRLAEGPSPERSAALDVVRRFESMSRDRMADFRARLAGAEAFAAQLRGVVSTGAEDHPHGDSGPTLP